MAVETFGIEDKKVDKELYDYQQKDIDKIFNVIDEHPEHYNLLYQLPTGGGKTVIFSQMVREYIQRTQKKVLILTHRIELCKQTSNMLDGFGVRNKIINSKVKELPDQEDYMCFVAMVETLNNRLHDEKLEIKDIGLVIIDECHHVGARMFCRCLKKTIFKYTLGLSATPNREDGLTKVFKYNPDERYSSEDLLKHNFKGEIIWNSQKQHVKRFQKYQ